MTHNANHKNYLLPAGSIALSEIFDIAGKSINKDLWTGDEKGLPVVDAELKSILQQDGEILPKIIEYFKAKKAEVSELRGAIVTAGDELEKRNNSFLSFLDDKNVKHKNIKTLQSVSQQHDETCNYYQSLADTLLLLSAEKVSINLESIQKYRLYFIVEEYLRQTFFAHIRTFLFNPDTGSTEDIPPQTWLGNEYNISFATGELIKDKQTHGIIIASENEFREHIAKYIEQGISKEKESFHKVIDDIIALEEKPVLNKEEQTTLLESIALECMRKYHKENGCYPRKLPLSSLVLKIIQERYANIFPGFKAPETVKRQIRMDKLMDKLQDQDT